MKKLFMTILFVGCTGSVVADGAQLLLEAVEQGNQEMVEMLLLEKSYTPKQLRGVLKVAYNVAEQKEAEKRSKMEWFKMVAGSLWALGCAEDCVNSYEKSEFLWVIACGLFGMWVGRGAYRGWYAPYGRYDRSVKISDALKTALSPQPVSGDAPVPAR